MGLDTTHDCWHGAYSAFTRWRDGLARAAGYDMRLVKYDDGFSANLVTAINWDEITEENLAGEWERTPEDPLFVLLARASGGDTAVAPKPVKPSSTQGGDAPSTHVARSADTPAGSTTCAAESDAAPASSTPGVGARRPPEPARRATRAKADRDGVVAGVVTPHGRQCMCLGCRSQRGRRA